MAGRPGAPLDGIPVDPVSGHLIRPLDGQAPPHPPLSGREAHCQVRWHCSSPQPGWLLSLERERGRASSARKHHRRRLRRAMAPARPESLVARAQRPRRCHSVDEVAEHLGRRRRLVLLLHPWISTSLMQGEVVGQSSLLAALNQICV